MKQYHDLLQHILENGDEIDTERTGVGTIATFGERIKFDLRKGFPAITTKKLAFKSVTSEMLWFLRGSDNVHELRSILHGEENKFNLEKSTIWDANYNEQAKNLGYSDGFMGDIYGSQWRDFGRETLKVEDESCKVVVYDDYKISGVDQVRLVIQEAQKNPQSRRLVISAWNPKVVWSEVERSLARGSYFVSSNEAALPPCHMMFQLNIVGDYIDLEWYQRSVDAFLGLPFNIASYAEICHVFGRILNKTPRSLIGALGNVHIYKNHINQVTEQLSRDHIPSPGLWINPELKTLQDFENASVDDFKLLDYVHHPKLTAPMAV